MFSCIMFRVLIVLIDGVWCGGRFVLGIGWVWGCGEGGCESVVGGSGKGAGGGGVGTGSAGVMCVGVVSELACGVGRCSV